MWTRDQTREWIAQLEHRVEDIDYYLKQTIAWCEANYIYDDRKVFMCSFLTCVWVCHMRRELISYKELLEILGLENIYAGDDSTYDLGPALEDIDHEELLNLVIRKLIDF